MPRSPLAGCGLLPFPVPHDAREPAQYHVLRWCCQKLGVLTDLGSVTAHVTALCCRQCDGLMLECNHDARMLADWPLSADAQGARRRERMAIWTTIRRRNAARCASSMTACGMYFAAHLSRQNNTPALARAALASAPSVARRSGSAWPDQDEGFDWRSL